MVASCCVYNCTNRVLKNSGLSFYSFPINKDIQKKWISRTWRKKFKPSKYSKVCSVHFLDSDYKEGPGHGNVSRKYRILKPEAIPSVFPNLPEHLQPKAPKIRRSLFLHTPEAQQKGII